MKSGKCEIWNVQGMEVECAGKKSIWNVECAGKLIWNMVQYVQCIDFGMCRVGKVKCGMCKVANVEGECVGK